MEKQVFIYDTALRDGNQAKGLSFSLEDKLAIARKLDDFGVDYIEGGWPNPTNPTDMEFFARARRMTWKHAKIAAFGSTCRPNGKPEEDHGLRHLVETRAPVITSPPENQAKMRRLSRERTKWPMGPIGRCQGGPRW